jgi:hypothetical protein
MLIRFRDPGISFTLDPGWKKFGSDIRDKHPGSATLVTNIKKSTFVLCSYYRVIAGFHVYVLADTTARVRHAEQCAWPLLSQPQLF